MSWLGIRTRRRTGSAHIFTSSLTSMPSRSHLGTTTAFYGTKRLVDSVCCHHALFEYPNGVFLVVAVRHPNTIAYPEKFFESAQAIAAHSHLRWPDLSREWIRRQEARIARGEFIGLSPRSSINNLVSLLFLQLIGNRGFLLYSGPVSRVCPFLLGNSRNF